MHLKALGILEISKEHPAETQKEFCRRCKNVNVYHVNHRFLFAIRWTSTITPCGSSS
jgi:hypothetical protein